MKKVVVIGANGAGMSAASQVKRQKPDWDVMVFEKGAYISYAACGIPYYVQDVVSKFEKLVLVTPEMAIGERKLDLRINSEVTAIEPEAKTVTVEGPEGVYSESFDYLVMATGALPLTGDIKFKLSPDGSEKRVFFVNKLDDGVAIKALIEKGAVKKCAVIGAGYIGIEMMEAFKDRGLETHLVHRSSSLARSFEPEISEIVMAEIEKSGVVMHLNNSVIGVSESVAGDNSNNNGEGAVTVHTEKGDLRFDLAILGTGVIPNSELAGRCGIETGVKGSVRVNEYMQTNIPYIYAVGDCAETKSLVTGKPLHIALALKANKEGVIAGKHICGLQESFPGVLGSAITKFFELGIARTGLTFGEAEEEGFEPVKIKLSAGSKAHYYSGAGKMNIVLIASQKDGRLLGAQLTGPEDSVKRIDVYATAITAAMTIDDIYNLDLAYAPPFSPVYDPVVLSGRIGRKTWSS